MSLKLSIMFVQTTSSTPDFGTLRIAIADAAADSPVLAALFARILVLLDALLGGLESLFARWQAGTLPAAPAPASRIRPVRHDTARRSNTRLRRALTPRTRAASDHTPCIAPAIVLVASPCRPPPAGAQRARPSPPPAFSTFSLMPQGQKCA